MAERNSTAVVLRLILWLLLPFSALWALMSLSVGLTFGFSLFRLDDLWPTMLWLLILALPIVIFHNLRVAGDDWRRLTMTLLGTLGFVAYFALTQIK